MILFHNRSADAASDTRRHLDKALVYLSVFNILESGDTVLNAVKCHIGISGCVLCHRLEDSSGRGEETCAAFGRVVKLLIKRDMLSLEPVGKLFKGKHSVNRTLVIFCLVLLCNAGTDEYRLCVRDAFLDIYAVCLHRRHYICKIGKLGREVFLYQKIDGMTAGGDDNIVLLLAKHSLIFGLNDGGADCGFLNVGKAELLKCLTHCINSNTVVICNKGGSKADDDRIAALDQNSDLFRAVHDLLCVLGAHNKAMTAQNALIADNMGLVTRKADSLNRAVTDTLIAVLTVGLFEC